MDGQASAAHPAYLHNGHFAHDASVHPMQGQQGAEHVYGATHHSGYNYAPPGYGAHMYGYNPGVYSFQPSVVNPAVMANDVGVPANASGVPVSAPHVQDASPAVTAAANMQQHYMPYPAHYFNNIPNAVQSNVPAYNVDTAPAAPNAGSDKPAKTTKQAEKSEAPRKFLRAHLKQPKQAPSAWQIFFNEELAKMRVDMPGVRLNVAQVSKGAGEKYNSLPASEKVKYQEESQRLKNQWEDDMRKWKESLSPEDIKLENAYRAQQRKAGKSRKSNLKDPHAPKKPMSAYFLFLRAVRASPEMKESVFGETEEMTKQSVLAASKWSSLPEQEKLPFILKAEQDKARYDEARKTYDNAMSHGVDASIAATRAHEAGLTVAAAMAASNAVMQKLQETGSLPPTISFDVKEEEANGTSEDALFHHEKPKKSKTVSAIKSGQAPAKLVQA